MGLINNADVPLPQVIPKPVSWVIHNNTRDHPYQHTNELSSDQNNTTTNDNYMDNQQHIMDNFYQRRNQPMVPGYDNVNMQGYMQQQQIPQFDDRWAFNNEKDKNWKRGGRSMRASVSCNNILSLKIYISNVKPSPKFVLGPIWSKFWICWR